MVINPVYEYITFNYKDYKHGHKFWFYDKSFNIWFKNEWHGLNLLWFYDNYYRLYYKNKCIYDEYYKRIYLGGIEYELKK